MIFQTFNPYYDDENYTYNRQQYSTNQDCFICFDLLDASGQAPISLYTHNNYISTCSCNGAVHKNCLNTWIKKSYKCPICRENVIIHNNKILEIIGRIHPSLLRFFVNDNILFRFGKFCLKIMLIFIFVVCFIDFYLSIFNFRFLNIFVNKKYNKHNLIYDQDLIYDPDLIYDQHYIEYYSHYDNRFIHSNYQIALIYTNSNNVIKL
jgi:hypothetical protein